MGVEVDIFLHHEVGKEDFAVFVLRLNAHQAIHLLVDYQDLEVHDTVFHWILVVLFVLQIVITYDLLDNIVYHQVGVFKLAEHMGFRFHI